MLREGDNVTIINSNKWKGCKGEVINITNNKALVKVCREFDLDGENWKEYAYVQFLLQNIQPDSWEDEYSANLKVFHIKRILSDKIHILDKPNAATKETYRDMLLEINKIIYM